MINIFKSKKFKEHLKLINKNYSNIDSEVVYASYKEDYMNNKLKDSEFSFLLVDLFNKHTTNKDIRFEIIYNYFKELTKDYKIDDYKTFINNIFRYDNLEPFELAYLNDLFTKKETQNIGLQDAYVMFNTYKKISMDRHVSDFLFELKVEEDYYNKGLKFLKNDKDIIESNDLSLEHFKEQINQNIMSISAKNNKENIKTLRTLFSSLKIDDETSKKLEIAFNDNKSIDELKSDFKDVFDKYPKLEKSRESFKIAYEHNDEIYTKAYNNKHKELNKDEIIDSIDFR